MAEEKPFKPSKRKLDKGRKDGKVLKSQLLSAGVGVFFGLLTLSVLDLSDLFKNEMLLEYSFNGEGLAALRHLKASARSMFSVITLSLLSVAFASFATSALISGFSFKWEALSPRASRLNPAQGIKKIFSNFGFLWQWGLRLAVFVVALYLLVDERFEGLVVATISGTYSISLSFWIDAIWKGLGFGVCALILLGAVEYAVNRYKFLKEMSMTHTELKREHKEDEGDPYLKSSRKSLHQELLSQNIVQRVRSSKVVIVERNF